MITVQKCYKGGIKIISTMTNNSLQNCLIYMSLINGKTIKENYTDLQKFSLQEGAKLNYRLLENKLLSEIKAHSTDPEKIKKLYRRVQYRIRNLKGFKEDVYLQHMVEVLVEDESDFERKITELVEYLHSKKHLKFGRKPSTVIDECCDIYYEVISRGKSHREAALRALISIPFRMMGHLGKKTRWIIIVTLLGLLAAFILQISALIAHFTVASAIWVLVDIIVSYVAIKWGKLDTIVKTLWNS